jgi:endogenous inhibitor of DNA gyrase (YacG/DUF329 family)
MSEGHSKYGETVERISVSYEPQEKYQTVDPWTNQRIEPGIPILSSVTGGKIILKEVDYFTVLCPECEIPAKYNEESEPICPVCGLICSGGHADQREQIVRDAKAAGRVDGGN